tara:strand:- start:1209 stop:1355 length:147 start_codon:yes stop_codon:yes gene_type:complete
MLIGIEMGGCDLLLGVWVDSIRRALISEMLKEQATGEPIITQLGRDLR